MGILRNYFAPAGSRSSEALILGAYNFHSHAFAHTLSSCSQSLPALIYVMGVVKHFSFGSSRLRAARSLPFFSPRVSQSFDRSSSKLLPVLSATPKVAELPNHELLLTSKSLPATTYATVCNCSFQTTLSPAPATLTRYPLPNSFPCHSYAIRGGGGVHTRVRNSLETKKSHTPRPRELALLTTSLHKSQVTNHQSRFTRCWQ
jgi:hypothetical protein